MHHLRHGRTLTRYRSIRLDTQRGSNANPAILSTISCVGCGQASVLFVSNDACVILVSMTTKSVSAWAEEPIAGSCVCIATRGLLQWSETVVATMNNCVGSLPACRTTKKMQRNQESHPEAADIHRKLNLTIAHHGRVIPAQPTVVRSNTPRQEALHRSSSTSKTK